MYALSSIITHVPISTNVLFSEAFFQPWLIAGLYLQEIADDGQVSVRKYADSAILFQDHLILIDVQQAVLRDQDREFELSQKKCLETFRLGLWKTRRLWSKINDCMRDGALYMDQDCQHRLPNTVKNITKLCLTLAFFQEEPQEFKSVPHSYSSIYDDSYFELSDTENPLLVYSFLDFAETMSQLKNLPELMRFFAYHQYVIAEHPDFGATSEISLLEQYYADRPAALPDHDLVQAEQFQSPWSVQSTPPNTGLDDRHIYARLPYQIDRPDLQNWSQRGTSGILFAVLMMIWIYIFLPIFSILAWMFGFYRFQYYAIQKYDVHIYELQFCLLLIGVGSIIFVAWALFYRMLSRIKWRRVEKKAVQTDHQLRVSRQEMMRYFEISNLNVHVARNEKICVFNFDDEGKIIDIQGKKMPDLHEEQSTLQRKIADFSQQMIESVIGGKISHEEAAQKIAAYAQSLGQSSTAS